MPNLPQLSQTISLSPSRARGDFTPAGRVPFATNGHGKPKVAASVRFGDLVNLTRFDQRMVLKALSEVANPEVVSHFSLSRDAVRWRENWWVRSGFEPETLVPGRYPRLYPIKLAHP